MTLDDDVRLMLSSDFFQALSPVHLRLLAFRADKLHLRANELLYRPGDPASSAYVILEGHVCLFSEKDEERVPIRDANLGDVLGELALIRPMNRMEGAVAVDGACLMVLERRAFRRIIQEYPEIIPALRTRITKTIQNIAKTIRKIPSL